jgi:GNAT superfamily N-acetyltransferase
MNSLRLDISTALRFFARRKAAFTVISSVLLLYSIDVALEYRRRRVASALIAFLQEIAESRRMKECCVLTTLSNTSAVELYKATGGILEPGETLLFVYPLLTSPG